MKSAVRKVRLCRRTAKNRTVTLCHYEFAVILRAFQRPQFKPRYWINSSTAPYNELRSGGLRLWREVRR
jgi:hypothetical protein